MNGKETEDMTNLTQAVRELIVGVRELNEKLDDYAPRAEVQRDGTRRAWKFFAAAVVTVLVAQVLTMTTISYCFLDATYTRKTACGVMPGYNEVMNQNDIRLARLNLLLSNIDVNRREIARLDAEIDRLNRVNGGQ